MAKLRVNKIAAVGVSTETTGSVFFDGTDDFMSLDGSSDFAFGTGDFAIEFWVYFNAGSFSSDSVDPNLIDFRPDNTNGAYPSIQYDTSANNLRYYVNTDNRIDGGQLSDQTWYHIALEREGTSTKMYVNGSQVGSTYSDSTDYLVGANRPVIACQGHNTSNNNRRLDGYISNLRICKGHAVYKSNFTPPTKELDVHPQSVLLVCYDGENIFADKTERHTGKISAIGDRLSSPTPTATDSPIGITTFQPGLTRSVDATAGPTFEGGVGYNSQNWLTLPKGTTEQRGNDRGVFGGGENPSANNVIQFVNMSSQGTSQDFGDLVRTQMDMGATGSRTRGLFAGGDETTAPLVEENTIQFITISTQGNASDYGDLTGRRKNIMGGGTSTRGVFGGGSNGSDHQNNIDYVTIATLGNAQDFGDLDKKPGERGASQVTGSPTRGIFYIKDNSINYITWATLGNALDFGDTDNNSGGAGAVGDTTRSCMHGTTASYNNSIEYITISTLGNGQDFGDLIVAMRYQYGASNPTRGVMAGAADPALNNINFITIQTTGNAQDFGDLNTGQQRGIGLSGCHGGIS